MKNLFYILLLFSGVFAFGQETFQVEGELQFINPNYGMIVLKDNAYYRVEVKAAPYNQTKKELVYTPIEESQVKEGLKNEHSIFYKDISEKYDFEKLKKLRFTWKEDDEDIEIGEEYDMYSFYQFNKNYFALSDENYKKRIVGSKKVGYRIGNMDISPYVFLSVGNKKVLHLYDRHEILFVIPTKKGIKLLEDWRIVPKVKTKKLKLTNAEIFEFSQHNFSELEDNYFKIDTLPNKKVRLKNAYNEVLVSQSYDSIVLRPIIYGYNNNKIDLYNLTFKKINKNSLQAIRGGLGSIQVIEKNKLKRIDWTGKKIKKPLGYGYVSLPEAPQYEYYYGVEIFKKDTDFVFKVKNLSWSAMEYDKTETDTLNLINTKGIKQFYFESNISKDTVSNDKEFYSYYYSDSYKIRITDIVSFDYEIIHFLKEDKTYGMNYLGYFLNSYNFKEYIKYVDFDKFEEYQSLQFIEYKYPFYKMKKDNLYKLYPMQKEFRYKKLEDFNGNFARFELPNAQKGWLDLEGNEYLDE